MKKFILFFATLALALSSKADVAINSTNFPDETFRSYLTNYMPGGSDGVFTNAEIAAITEINMRGGIWVMTIRFPTPCNGGNSSTTVH